MAHFGGDSQGTFHQAPNRKKYCNSILAPKELGLYYLQSRYYDPDLCRFLNTDAYVSTGQGELGNNMFAYCLNNPIIYVDKTGALAQDAIDLNDEDDETLEPDAGGGLWSSFISAVDGASYGLSMAMGSAPRSPEMVSKRYIDAQNIDAHGFKQKAGKVSPKQLSRYDIYKDKSDHNHLWVGSKNPQNRDWRPTEFFFSDLEDYWRK